MSESMKPKKELKCCLGCGRDTRHDYCTRCIGHVSRGRRDRLARITEQLPLEDDYGEESDADSVCEDNSASVTRLL